MATSRVLVTGAGRGLGLEFVRQLLARGDSVLATARQPRQAEQLQLLAAAHPDRLHVLTLDVADSDSFQAFMVAVAARMSAIDLLINNAGILASGERFGQLSAQNLLDSFRTNTVGPLLLAQALAPLLKRGNQPLVLNMTSILGSIAQTEGFHTPSYGISKAALNMAGVLLGHALSESAVRVVNLHPGWVRTEMGGEGANLDKDVAVRTILATLGKLAPNATGIYIDLHGETLPW